MDVLWSVGEPLGRWPKIRWYEQLPAAPGDANADSEFNQEDILLGLRDAKYLTRDPATWGEGDWNADGVFDQQDIVAALQTGNYLQGPYAAGAVDVVFSESGC